ncbi:MAG: ABC transporter substrate-binding protein [Anaerolineae bacterium]|nr:ABC transporter substrate-binding protein [Anaerolineae bacterium]
MQKMRGVGLMLLIFSLVLPAVAQDAAATEEPFDMATMPGLWETCPTPASLSGDLTIGAIFIQTGNASVYGIPQTQAVELALAEINATGYLGAATLNVLVEDSAGDAEQAIAAMTKLVEEDGVLAVLGPTLSTEAFAADPIAQENGTVVMGVSNTARGITDMGEFVFRNSLPESSVIPGTVAGTTAALGLEAVGVLYGNDDDFTRSGYDVFRTELEANNVAILGEETFARGDTDFSAQLTNLLALEPQALVVSALAAEATQIIVQARDLGYTGPIIGGNGFNSPAIITNAGDAAEGVIVGAAWNAASADPYSLAWIEKYTEAYGSPPDQFATQAYTGAWLLATAIRCADSTDKTAIRDALAGISEFPSPLGLFAFDENRDPVHEPVVQIVQAGVFAVLETGE